MSGKITGMQWDSFRYMRYFAIRLDTPWSGTPVTEEWVQMLALVTGLSVAFVILLFVMILNPVGDTTKDGVFASEMK